MRARGPALVTGALAGLLALAAATPAAATGRGADSARLHQLTLRGPDPRPSQGARLAEVTVLVLLNPLSQAARPLWEKATALQQRSPGTVRLVYVLLGRHGAVNMASRALVAAHRQGRFLPLLAELLPRPGRSGLAGAVDLEKRARAAGLDLVKLRRDLDLPEVRQHVVEDNKLAGLLGLSGSQPALAINGRLLPEPSSDADLERALLRAQREAAELLDRGVPLAELNERLLAKHHPRYAESRAQALAAAQGRPAPVLTVSSHAARLAAATPASATLSMLGPLPQASALVRSYRRRRVHAVFAASGQRHVDTSRSPTRGPSRAKVTLAVFADFVNDDARQLAGVLRRVMAANRGRVQLAFMHLPGYVRRREAFKVAEVAAAAQAAGCFWGFYDRMYFQRPPKKPARPARDAAAATPAIRVGSYSPSAAERRAEEAAQTAVAVAQRAGCRKARLESELAGSSARSRVYSDLAQASLLGVYRSPSVLVNGRPVGLTYAALQAAIRDELRRVAGGRRPR